MRLASQTGVGITTTKGLLGSSNSRLRVRDKAAADLTVGPIGADPHRFEQDTSSARYDGESNAWSSRYAP